MSAPLTARSRRIDADVDLLDVAGADGVVFERGPDGLGGRGEALRIEVPALAAEHLRGKKVVAFCGIGRPEKFFATLREIGAEVTEAVGFPDHHPFTRREIAALSARAAASNARLVTTVKDLTRLPADIRDNVAVLPVDLLWSDPAAAQALLHRLDRR